VIAEGAHADLALFDADTVDEAATYAEPIAPARGIDTVVVNGRIVWRGGRATGERPGQVLSRALHGAAA
jgi:N-acyl-D-amino-acid deacylase